VCDVSVRCVCVCFWEMCLCGCERCVCLWLFFLVFRFPFCGDGCGSVAGVFCERGVVSS